MEAEMKRMGVFVGIAAVSFPAITFAQSSIEVGERREPVFYSESQFVITLDDTLASEATISQLNVAGVVKNDSEPTTWGNGFWVIEVSDTLSVNEAVLLMSFVPSHWRWTNLAALTMSLIWSLSGMPMPLIPISKVN
jgi:hypothetical protein